MTEPYVPRPLTIERCPHDPDRFMLTYEASDAFPESSSYLVTWHDAVLAVEFQCPSLRREPGGAPHPAVTGILDDVRGGTETGVASYRIPGEPRQVMA